MGQGIRPRVRFGGCIVAWDVIFRFACLIAGRGVRLLFIAPACFSTLVDSTGGKRASRLS